MVDILALISSILFTPVFSISFFYETGVVNTPSFLDTCRPFIVAFKEQCWNHNGGELS